MKKHLFLKSLLVLIGVLITSLTTQAWAAKIDNTNWANFYNTCTNSSISLSNSNNNKYTGVVYMPASSTYEVKIQTGKNSEWSGWYRTDGSSAYTFTSVNTTYDGLAQKDGNDKITTKSSTSGFVKVNVEFWGEYSGNSSLRLYQSDVDALSLASLGRSSSTVASNGTITVTPNTPAGGSGSYHYEYSCSPIGYMDGSTFHAPYVFTPTEVTITVTMTDNNSQLSGLASVQKTTTVTVNRPDNMYIKTQFNDFVTWGWVTLPSNGDGTYSVTAKYKGNTGCNWSVTSGDESQYIEHTSYTKVHDAVNDPLSNGDDCTFKLTPTSWTDASKVASVTITKRVAVTATKVSLGNGAGSEGTPSISGTSYADGKVDYNTSVTFTAPDEATGYRWKGWYTNNTGTGAAYNSNKSFTETVTSAKTYYAIYEPITYTLTFHLNGGNSWGDLGDATSSDGVVTLNVTYDQVLDELTLPHAIKNAYHFDTWSTSSTSSSAAIWKYDYSVVPRIYHWYAYTGYVTKVGSNYYWKRAGNVDLYAYYDAPELHSLRFTPENVVPEGDVTATIQFSPVMGEPEGTYMLCYKLTTAAGVILSVQPEWQDKDDAAHTVSFQAPGSPGDYSLGIKLFPGSSSTWDSGGHSYYFDGNVSKVAAASSFEVESMNTVTVSYKSGSVDLRPSTTVRATWSNPATVTAPDIPGMEFVNWTHTGSAYIKSGYSVTDKTIEVQASGAGTVTANYSQGSLFFKDTKGWVADPATDSIYIYFYSTTAYWTTSSGNSEGTGSNKSHNSAFHSGPFAMTLLEGTDDVYYYAGDAPAYAAVAFSKEKMKNYDYFAGSEAKPCNVVYVNSFNSSKPMIVPVGNGAIWNIKKARYYAHDLAPLLPDWGYDLRGDNDYIGWSPATDADKHKMVAPRLGDLSFSTDIYFDNALDNKEWKIYNGTKGYGRSDNQKLTYSSQTSGVLTNHDASGYNLKIQTNIAGNYTFTLNFGTDCSEATYSGAKVSDANGLMGHMTVKITYPVAPNDFRLVYTGGSKPHPGNVVKKRANGEDIVSMYVASGKSSYLKVQPCSSASVSSVSWTALGSCSAPSYADGVNFATILSEGGPGTYNFTITQDENKVAKITKVEKYTGNFYIRTDCVNSDKWNFWNSKSDHAMTYSDYSTTLKTDPYSHYFVKWISGDNVIVKYCVANDYSYAISDTLDTDDVLTSGPNVKVSATNVRFTYNQETNTLKRAYTYGPSNNMYMLLRTKYVTGENGTNAHLYKSWTSTSVYTLLGGTNISLDGAAVDTLKLTDNGNWVYQADVYARPGAPVKLTGYFNGATQYFKGTTGTAYATTGEGADAEQLMGGTSNPQHMRITYDFKTNRMMTAWIPSSDVTGKLDINADIMLLRREQEGATSITFSGAGKLEDVKTAYGVMEFRKSYINDYSLSRYVRNLYWISFPFDVNLSDVFGFGKYGQHWIIEFYDGKGRAEKGYWAESEPNWKFVTEEVKDEFVLKANEGYILALALSNMGEYSSVWEGGKISSVHLYFPSAHEIGNLSNVSSVTVDMDTTGYMCKITRDSRNIKDSYWHCIGAPSYAQNTRTGLPTTQPANWETKLPYVYVWNSLNNSLDINSTGSVTFEAMHSYLVQHPDDVLVWTNVTNTPSSIVRRKVEGREADFYEWNLKLQRNGEQMDHTYVRMTNDENATENFDFGQDLSKEFNSGANIYSFVEGVQVAGNVMPIEVNATKVVPVGMKITEVGEYTFSMPEGTNGVSVVLVDNETGERTNLGLVDYTISLEAGTYDERFALEISPVKQTPTDIELLNGENGENGVRKVMIDGILYIVKDGKVFDARGSRVR